MFFENLRCDIKTFGGNFFSKLYMSRHILIKKSFSVISFFHKSPLILGKKT